MKVKTVIENSAAARRLSNWLKAKETVPEVSGPPLEFKEFIMNYPIDDLINRNLHKFQRELQASRLIKIADKVLEFGYLCIPIILDELYKMVDGQHRVVVAYMLGLKTVPTVVYNFKNPRTKPHIFSRISMPEGGGPALFDRINSRRIAGYPYETLIYQLILSDTTSMFYNKVSYKDMPNNKKRIPLPVFMKILNWIGLGIRRKWDNGYDGFLQHTVQQMNENAYLELKGRINNFAHWFFQWAGSDREGNKDLLKEKVLLGFLDFYLMMLDQHPIPREVKRVERESIKRFKGFPVINLLHLDMEGIPAAILKKYNHGRLGVNRIKEVELGIRIEQVWGRESV